MFPTCRKCGEQTQSFNTCYFKCPGCKRVVENWELVTKQLLETPISIS